MHDSYHHIRGTQRIDELSVLPGQNLIWMALCGEHCSSASHMLVLVLRRADHIAVTVSISL